MNSIFKSIELFKIFLTEVGELSFFAGRFFKEATKSPFEFREFLRQCYNMGNRSLLLVLLVYHWTGLLFNQDLHF